LQAEPRLSAARPAAPAAELNPQETATQAVLRENPDTPEALARRLGVEPVWTEQIAAGAPAAINAEESEARRLLAEHLETAKALATLLQ
jgi:hypothetical protein